MSKGKRKAPQKDCLGCGVQCHARCSTCKSCGYEFYEKTKDKQKRLAKNWRELKQGDVIKSITGSGPYFLSRDRPGEKIMMGHKGKFEVVAIYDNGPKSCGIVGRQLSGRKVRASYVEYIYMGETYYNDDLSQHEEPHKIRVLKKTQPK